MRPRLLVAIAALSILVVVATVVALTGRAETPAPVAEHPVTVPESPRTVLVSSRMPMPSAHERRLSAMLEEGELPKLPVLADVLTDTDCAPDAQMISRCRNVVRLADGRELVLRHPHDMTKVPCLAPGERVRLIPTGVD